MSEEFKPCPFCGGIETTISSNCVETQFVTCLSCGAEGPGGRDIEAARKLWNERKGEK